MLKMGNFTNDKYSCYSYDTLIFYIISFSNLDICKFCTENKEKEARPMTKKTPLSTATRTALIQEVRAQRTSLKEKERIISQKVALESLPTSQELQV